MAINLWQLLLLLLCIYSSVLTAIASENATVVQGKVAPVNASTRASANEAFAGLWQVKGTAAVEFTKLTLDLPGRVFVTHSPSLLASSESAAEIRVSGSSEDVVKSVGVLVSANAVDVFATRKPLAGEYLLVELQLRQKNSVRKLFSTGSGDVMVEDGVLASFDSAAASGSTKRLLQQVVASTPTTMGVNSVNSDVTGGGAFVVEEVVTSSKASSAAATHARTWLVRRRSTGSTDPASVSVGLSVPGLAVIDQVRESSRSSEPFAGRVMVVGTDALKIEQVEVVLAATTSGTTGGHSLQVQLKSSALASSVGNVMTVVGFAAAYPVAAVTATETVRVKEIQKARTYAGEALHVGNSGEGTVFIAAANSAMLASSMTLTSHKTGGIQVELGAIWTSDQLSLVTMSSGTITLHSEVVSSQIAMAPSANGKICVTASHNLTDVSVSRGSADDTSRDARVSYTGKSGASRLCVRQRVPARIPASTTSVATEAGEVGSDTEGTSKSVGSAVASVSEMTRAMFATMCAAVVVSALL